MNTTADKSIKIYSTIPPANVKMNLRQENFLKDPKGDIPWIEEEAAQDVLHLDYPAFKR